MGALIVIWLLCKILNVKWVVKEILQWMQWLGWKENCKTLNVSCTFSICAFDFGESKRKRLKNVF